MPLIGHLNPLLRQAMELHRRGAADHNIYIISCSNIKTYVENYCLNTTIEFIDIGSCMNETDFQVIFNKIITDGNSFSSKLALMQIAIEIAYPQMYEQMMQVIDPEIFRDQSKIVAIVDLGTFAGADFADYFGIPYLINNGDLLPYLGWHDAGAADYNPSLFVDAPQSIHSLRTNLLLRTLSPLVRLITTIYAYFQFDRSFNAMRQTRFHFNNSVHVLSRYHSHMILVNSVFGIEYAQHLPPYVQCTGPMLPMKLPRDYYLTQLEPDDRQWLEIDSRPIIYVNFGTLVSLSKALIDKILLALPSTDQYRVLWKLDERHQLPTNVPPNIRIVPWLSSTLAHLAHPNVQLFISHCGINSAYESLWLGTPILCIPFFADQYDMAQRLADAGVGQWLNHQTFTTEKFRETLAHMFTAEEQVLRQRNIERIQAMILLHGGVERAVDLIEMVAEYGVKALVPVENAYPWYACYNFDVYTIWLLSCLVLRQVILRCCCDRPSRTEKTMKMKTS